MSGARPRLYLLRLHAGDLRSQPPPRELNPPRQFQRMLRLLHRPLAHPAQFVLGQRPTGTAGHQREQLLRRGRSTVDTTKRQPQRCLVTLPQQPQQRAARSDRPLHVQRRQRARRIGSIRPHRNPFGLARRRERRHRLILNSRRRGLTTVHPIDRLLHAIGPRVGLINGRALRPTHNGRHRQPPQVRHLPPTWPNPLRTPRHLCLRLHATSVRHTPDKTRHHQAAPPKRPQQSALKAALRPRLSAEPPGGGAVLPALSLTRSPSPSRARQQLLRRPAGPLRSPANFLPLRPLTASLRDRARRPVRAGGDTPLPHGRAGRTAGPYATSQERHP